MGASSWLCDDVRGCVGDGSVAEMRLRQRDASSKIVARLESLLGPVGSDSKMGCEYNQVAPVPCVFGVPSDFVVTMCHDEQDTAGSALDGWTMHAQPGVGSLSALVFYPSFARPPNVNSSRSDR